MDRGRPHEGEPAPGAADGYCFPNSVETQSSLQVLHPEARETPRCCHRHNWTQRSMRRSCRVNHDMVPFRMTQHGQWAAIFPWTGQLPMSRDSPFPVPRCAGLRSRHKESDCWDERRETKGFLSRLPVLPIPTLRSWPRTVQRKCHRSPPPCMFRRIGSNR